MSMQHVSCKCGNDWSFECDSSIISGPIVVDACVKCAQPPRPTISAERVQELFDRYADTPVSYKVYALSLAEFTAALREAGVTITGSEHD